MKKIDLKKLFKVISDDILEKTSEGFNNIINERINSNITKYTKNSTGSLLRSFKPLYNKGKVGRYSIAYIGKGIAARLLEEGVNSPVNPYDRTDGTFLSFVDNPDLKDWAIAVNHKNKDGVGITVGNPLRTNFGKKKWWTKTLDETPIFVRSEILDLLRKGNKKIKL